MWVRVMAAAGGGEKGGGTHLRLCSPYVARSVAASVRGRGALALQSSRRCLVHGDTPRRAVICGDVRCDSSRPGRISGAGGSRPLPSRALGSSQLSTTPRA